MAKLRFNCYLLRDGLSEPVLALRAKYRPGGSQPMDPLPVTGSAPVGMVAYFRARSEKSPPWASALAEYFPGLSQAMNMSNRFVIFLPVDGRFFAVCFGYGSSTLDWAKVEANFGLRFAARRLEPDGLSDFRSRRVGASSRTQSVQIPFGGGLRDFDVPLDGEFVRKLAGRLNSDGIEIGESGIFIATDSIAFKAETNLNEIAEALRSMLEEVERLQPTEELQFVDALVPLRSKDPLVEDLETLLAAAIFPTSAQSIRRHLKDQRLAQLSEYVLEFSPPDSVNMDTVDHMQIFRGRDEDGASEVLDSASLSGLEIALGNMGGRYGRASLRSVRLMAIGDDGEPASGMMPLRDWLVFEVGTADTRYILTLGKWFSLDEDYTQRLNSDLSEIDHVTSILALPDWPRHLSETQYNAQVSKADLLCLDTVDVRPGDGDEVESCDFLHRDGYLIHVKKYSGSQTLSHLFSQGLVSAQLLASDNIYRKNFNEAVRQLDPSFLTTAEATPKFVTYAIGHVKNRSLPDDLPTFSKVNLRDFARRLRLSQVRPSLCRIQIV
nr:DUF6119 family protein [Cryptosporangium phraense]